MCYTLIKEAVIMKELKQIVEGFERIEDAIDVAIRNINKINESVK